MSRILLVGNKGSLFDKIYNRIKLDSNIHLFSINISRGDNLSFIYKKFWNAVNSFVFDKIIYIGGETRDKSLMECFNYLLPVKMFNFAKANRIRFIYLSSLSVYEKSYDLLKNQKIETLSADTPYGSTKLKLEQEISRSKYLNYVGIRPASLFSGKGRSSIERVFFLSENNFVFKYFQFPGLITYLPVDDLVEEVYDSSVNYDIQGFVNLARYVRVSDIQKGVSRRYRVPVFIPNICLTILLKILPVRFANILKSLFGEVRYP